MRISAGAPRAARHLTDSTHIDEEGVLIDNVKLVDRGTLLEAEAEALLGSCKYPCRNNQPEHGRPQGAGGREQQTGRQELLKVVENYGIDVVQAYMGHVQDNAEEERAPGDRPAA